MTTTALLLTVVAACMTACNTVKGAGKDLESAAESVDLRVVAISAPRSVGLSADMLAHSLFWRTCAGVVTVLGALLAAVYIALPASRPAYTVEDGFIEQATATCFLLASLLGTVIWVQAREGQPWLLLVPAIALLGFLDEMSFGQRLFRFTPAKIGGVELDAIHDVLLLMLKNVNQWVLLYLSLLATIFMWVAFRTRRVRHLVRKCWRYPALQMMVAAGVLAIAAQAIDLMEVNYIRSLAACEEVLELLASVLMLFASAAVALGESAAETGQESIAQASRHRTTRRAPEQPYFV